MHSTLVKYTLLSGANMLFAMALYSLNTGPVANSPVLMYSLLISSVAGCVYGLFLSTPSIDVPDVLAEASTVYGLRSYAVAR